MNNCKICNKETKNEIYCSTKCQHIGYKKNKVDRIKLNCLFCKKEFETLQNKIDNGKKYCSRTCKDTHQKELYLNDGNPSFNIKKSTDWKKFTSDRMKKIWKTNEHKDKVKHGQNKFFENNGFWYGTDEKSNEKRAITNLEKYGVKSILSLDEQIKNREDICLSKYGKTSFELMREGLKKMDKSYIEVKIAKLLLSSNIKFETQYDVYDNFNKFKTYDFFLSDFNLLIEADGDYWHANPIKYNNKNLLTEVQIKNIKNDNFKNNLAKERGYNLLRFWETEIKKKNFKYLLLKKIKENGKN